MLIRAGYEIRFEAEIPTAMLAMLSIHPSRHTDLKTPQRIEPSPDIPIYNYEDAFGNICTRLTVPIGGVTLAADFVIEDSGLEDVRAPDVPPTPVELLPDDILIFLLGSRYCETDRLMDVAWAEFGHQNRPKPALKSTVASLTMWFARLVNESTASEAAPH